MSNTHDPVGSQYGEESLEYVTIASETYSVSLIAGSLQISGNGLSFHHLVGQVESYAVIGHPTGGILFYQIAGIAYRAVLPPFPNQVTNVLTIGPSTSLDATLLVSGEVILVYLDGQGYTWWNVYDGVTSEVPSSSHTWVMDEYDHLAAFRNFDGQGVSITALTAEGSVDEADYSFIQEERHDLLTKRGIRLDSVSIEGETLTIKGKGFDPLPWRDTGVQLPFPPEAGTPQQWDGKLWMPVAGKGGRSYTYDGANAALVPNLTLVPTGSTGVAVNPVTGHLISITGGGSRPVVREYGAYAGQVETEATERPVFSKGALLHLGDSADDLDCWSVSVSGQSLIIGRAGQEGSPLDGVTSLPGSNPPTVASLDVHQGPSGVKTIVVVAHGRFAEVGGLQPESDQARIVKVDPTTGVSTLAYSNDQGVAYLNGDMGPYTHLYVQGAPQEHLRVSLLDFSNMVPLNLPGSSTDWVFIQLGGRRGSGASTSSTFLGHVSGEIYEYALGTGILNKVATGMASVPNTMAVYKGRLVAASTSEASALYEGAVPSYPLVEGSFDFSRLLSRNNTLIEYDLTGLTHPTSIGLRTFDKIDMAADVINLSTEGSRSVGATLPLSGVIPASVTQALVEFNEFGEDGQGPLGSYKRFSGSQVVELPLSHNIDPSVRAFSTSFRYRVWDRASLESSVPFTLLHVANALGGDVCRIYVGMDYHLRFSVQLQDGSSVEGVITDPGDLFLQENKWHHLHLSWDGTHLGKIRPRFDGRMLNVAYTGSASEEGRSLIAVKAAMGARFDGTAWIPEASGIDLCAYKWDQNGTTFNDHWFLPVIKAGNSYSDPTDGVVVPLSDKDGTVEFELLGPSTLQYPGPVSDLVSRGIVSTFVSEGLTVNPTSGAPGDSVEVDVGKLVWPLAGPGIKVEAFTGVGKDTPISSWGAGLLQTDTPYGHGCKSEGLADSLLSFGTSLTLGCTSFWISAYGRGMNGWWFSELNTVSTLESLGGFRLFADATGFEVLFHNRAAMLGHLTEIGDQKRHLRFVAPQNYDPSAWHHHFIQYNLLGGTGNPQYYLDGVEITDVDWTPTYTSNTPFTAGGGGSYPEAHESGEIDFGLNHAYLFGAPGDAQYASGELAHFVVGAPGAMSPQDINWLAFRPIVRISGQERPYFISNYGSKLTTTIPNAGSVVVGG